MVDGLLMVSSLGPRISNATNANAFNIDHMQRKLMQVQEALVCLQCGCAQTHSQRIQGIFALVYPHVSIMGCWMSRNSV